MEALLEALHTRLNWQCSQPSASPLLPSLQDLAAPHALVRRDSEWRELAVRELVPGDLIALKGGDVIPADCKASPSCRVPLQPTGLLPGLGWRPAACRASCMWQSARSAPCSAARADSASLHLSHAAGGPWRAPQGGRVVTDRRVAGGDQAARGQGGLGRRGGSSGGSASTGGGKGRLVPPRTCQPRSLPPQLS